MLLFTKVKQPLLGHLQPPNSYTYDLRIEN